MEYELAGESGSVALIFEDDEASELFPGSVLLSYFIDDFQLARVKMR